METRKELVEKLNVLRAEETKIQAKINLLDKENKIKELTTYLKKCFKRTDVSHLNIDCFQEVYLYVYEINKGEQDLKALEINYFSDDDLYTSISTVNLSFDTDYDSVYKYEEVSKVEFDIHYSKANNRIKNTLIK